MKNISKCLLNKIYDIIENILKESDFIVILVREIHERPIYIEIGKKDDNDNFSIAKIKLFEFSTCGQYLALKHELYPTTLWIWNICTDYLDYLLLENPITGM